MNSTQLINVLEHLSKLQLNHINDNHDEHIHHDGHNNNDDSDSDSNIVDTSQLIIAKATAMTVLFCASTLCGSIPFLLNRWFKWTDSNVKQSPRSANIIKCLLYFGGGVLLCTTFLHLLPEVKENIMDLQSKNILNQLNFHLAELLMCIGFFTMFFVEEIIHSYIHKQTKKNLEQMAFERGRSIQNSFLMRNNPNNHNNNNNNNDDDTIYKPSLNTNNSIKNDIDNVENDNKLSVKDLIQKDIENQKYEKQNYHQDNQHNHNDRQIITKSPALNGKNNSNNNHHTHQHHHHHHQHSHHHHDHHHGHGHSHNIPIGIDEHTIVSSLRGLLVVLALSLHELFEGLAVGLESESKKVWYMFAAVSAHKLVLAFCVGVELLVARTRLWLAIIYVITFAIVSPIGIGIGIGISNQNSPTSAIPSAILQGLATGTLLYVVFFEILSKERCGFKAYFAFIVGFSIMFGLQFATGHDHTHSHGDSHDHDDDHHHHDDHDHTAKQIEDQIKLLRAAAKDFVNK